MAERVCCGDCSICPLVNDPISPIRDTQKCRTYRMFIGQNKMMVAVAQILNKVQSIERQLTDANDRIDELSIIIGGGNDEFVGSNENHTEPIKADDNSAIDSNTLADGKVG